MAIPPPQNKITNQKKRKHFPIVPVPLFPIDSYLGTILNDIMTGEVKTFYL